ncbi:MAG: ATP-dependent helicase/nuclease subunit, partial [Fimbriimonadaceae bacterium]|nr:ATP-dependent helicase/nuclease subunit [Fimbriimonadaceae bacterium]
MRSKSIDPTPEQHAVIDSQDRSLVVLASAGAGKTGTLVERYLRHVRDGVSPDQILTITFTRKAAAEMKRRIVESLLDRGLRDEAQIAETGPIQTIHGFCERLLRENSVAAGMDPGFDVLSESEASRLVDECVRTAIAEPTGECGHAEALISSLAGEAEYGQPSPHGKLEGAIREALHSFRGSGAEFEELWDIYSDPSAIRFHWQSKLLESLPIEVQEALKEVEPGAGVFDRLRSAYKACSLRMPRWLSSRVDPAVDQEAAEQACGLMHLVCSAWASLEREMERRQALDFVALETKAVALLKNSPSCAGRVRRQYKIAMIDEAQDVNPVQYQLLEALGLETEMLVGDPQQSIYGFRQADVELFKQRALAPNTKRLSKNWRSTDGILQFVDLLFGRLWTDYSPMLVNNAPMDFDSPAEQDCTGVELWMQQEEDSFEVARGISELHKEGEPLRNIAVLVRGLRFGIQIQRELTALGISSRIAGGTEKFYTRLEIRDIANALVALTNPYDDFALLATLRSPFCGLSLDSVALLAKRRPVIEGLSSYVPPVPEEADKIARFLRWFEPISRYADRLPAWEVLSEVLAVSEYMETLAKRRNADQLLANVRKLLALASQEPELGPAEYAQRIREIQNLKHREGDAPAEDDLADMVTIMTIHKAKGLEFEVVVVPEMHYGFEPKRQTLEIEPRLAMLVPRFGKTVSPYYAWVAEQRKQRQ